MEDIIIILVSPQMGENIGAIARGMKNFGLGELRIVKPRDGWPNEKAYEMAVSGRDILDRAKIYEDFESSVADVAMVYATSARLRSFNKPVCQPEEMAKEIVLFAKGRKIAILFGRENNGLDNSELGLADKLVTIPVSKEFGSLNIAQSGVVIFYEIFKHMMSSDNSENQSNQQLEYATGGEISSLFEHLETELDRSGFFKAPDKREGMILNIRSIFKRIKDFSAQDVRTLRGIIKCLSCGR